MAEEKLPHPLVAVANELEVDVEMGAEREPQPGDIDADHIDAVLMENEMSNEEKARVAKVINLIADKNDDLTGQGLLLEILDEYRTVALEEMAKTHEMLE